MITRASFGSSLLRAASIILSFAVSAVLARALTLPDFGIYSLAITVAMFVAVPLTTALSNLSVREVSRMRAAATVEMVKPLIRWADGVTIKVVALSIPVALWVSASWSGSESIEDSKLFLCVILGLALPLTMPLTGARSSVLRAFGYVNLGQAPDAIVRPALLAIFGLLFLIYGGSGGFGAIAAVLAHGCAACCALGISLAFLRRADFGSSISSQTDVNKSLGSMWRQFTPLYGLALLQLANSSADLLFLGAFRAPEEVAIYKIATQLSAVVGFGLLAINPILHGRITFLYESGRIAELKELVATGTLYTFLLAFPPLLLLIFFDDFIVNFLFGAQFDRVALVLPVLLVGQAAAVFFGPTAALLNMTGNEYDTFRGMTYAFLLSVFLSVTLIPEAGIIGAAIANSCSLLTWKLYLWMMVRKKLGVESSVLNILQLFKRRTKRGMGL